MEPFYRTIIGVARTLFAAQGLKFTITGEDRIPKVGGAVIAINHTGYMDFTYAGIPARPSRRYIRFMAKKEVFDHKISGPMMRAMKHIPVDRGDAGDSYRLAVEALRAGELVGVFPEETISRSFELKNFRTGAARMALEAGVPVIPMIVWGSQRVWTKGHPKRLGRTNTPITIRVGEPIEPYGPAAEMTAELHATMEKMLHEVQDAYRHEPGTYWTPRRFGGTAPTLEEASALDEAAAAERRARKERERAERERGNEGGDGQGGGTGSGPSAQ
ncbi:lysophospholipid acyltransferase family protein [Rhodococcus chondri]|uniref:Lysophospholipid acyltransferase family protein n=1 Tax=Rhodococcus chondri TaxID=3065941 RepID=A0ABU7JL56_9NOCA|nr:lysophospholipid acyltransferase family protein [Rhodococcus sp. CC-R104]MEE2030763.1 lysophospholipid acyltransferase family protein [Rhodococcus sp. CC-R104]